MRSMETTTKTQTIHPAYNIAVQSAVDPTASDEVRLAAIKDVLGDTGAAEVWSQDTTDAGGPTGATMADIYFENQECRRFIIDAAYAQRNTLPTSRTEYREWAEAIATDALEAISDHQVAKAAAQYR